MRKQIQAKYLIIGLLLFLPGLFFTLSYIPRLGNNSGYLVPLFMWVFFFILPGAIYLIYFVYILYLYHEFDKTVEKSEKSRGVFRERKKKYDSINDYLRTLSKLSSTELKAELRALGRLPKQLARSSVKIKLSYNTCFFCGTLLILYQESLEYCPNCQRFL